MTALSPESAGREFARTRADAEEARLALVDAIRAAHAAGWSEARIAQAAGIHRGTVRKALGKGKG